MLDVYLFFCPLKDTYTATERKHLVPQLINGTFQTFHTMSWKYFWSCIVIFMQLRFHINDLKCAQCIKRSNCAASHEEIQPKTFFSAILILAKHCQKTVKTSQPPLNVLSLFIITEKFFVQSIWNDAPKIQLTSYKFSPL